MTAELFPGIGPAQPPKAEKPRNPHPHRGKHLVVGALSVALAAGAGSGGVWWLRHTNQENAASSTAGGTTGGNTNKGGQPITGPKVTPSSRPPASPSHTATPSHEVQKGQDTKGLTLECSLGASAITKDGGELHVKPILKVHGGHPDASRFYTVADVITGKTSADQHRAGTFTAEGKGASVTATVPTDFQFPRDDVPVQVEYFPVGQPIPGDSEMSFFNTHPIHAVFAACGNASVTYALAHGGIHLPDGVNLNGN